LSEFVGQLHVLGKHVIGITIGKPPKELCVWANRWAKHRLQILAQHHPMMFFADKYRDKWREYASRLTTEPFVDRCGNEFPALIIDTDWLEKHDSKRKIDDLDEANGPARAVILVPPFRGFLDQAIGYFDEFVSACLSESEKIKRLESKHVHPGC
jgi:hypothetical protein